MHNCGFGLRNEEKYIAVAKQMAQIVVAFEDATKHILGYREKHPEVVQGWKTCHRALDYVYSGDKAQIDPWGLCHTSKEGIVTPKGVIRYPDLRKETNEESGKAEWVYGTGRNKARIYAGKVTENCLAAGTLVLTDSGWKPIEHVRSTDKVHDGDTWVSHAGTIYKSVQQCVIVDGVYMTADHEVFDEHRNWKEASQLPRPYRPAVRSADRLTPVAQQRKAVVLGVQMPVREVVYEVGAGCDERSKALRDTELWLLNHAAYFRGESNTWNDEAPGVRGVAQYVRPVSTAVASSVEKLRSAWNTCVRSVAGVFRELLERHGRLVPAGVRLGSEGQRRAVLPGKLSVDYASGKHDEQTQHVARGHTGGVKNHRDTEVDAVLPAQARSVFDVLNAGPQNRFVVLGTGGPFIVHNCVQHLARHVLSDNMLEVRQQTGYWPVHTVHDELIYIVPEGQAQAMLDTVQAVMRTPPVWWPELVVYSEGSIGDNYGEAK